MSDGLYVPLHDGDLSLALLTEAHREGLRVACMQDDAIWDLYPVSYQGEAFDPQFEALLTGAPKRRVYAILQNDTVVGMTAWIEQGPPGWSIEIGNTFITPALACGFERVGFKVDLRNTRSQAAVTKLGATREGVLRHERQTWTGHVRDTVSFSLLRDEWPKPL